MHTAEQWERIARSYTQGFSDSAIEEITAALVSADEAGQQSSVWHEVNQYVRRTLVLDRCNLCGGTTRPGQAPHALCVARAKHGTPQQRMDETLPCPCARCSRVAEVAR